MAWVIKMSILDNIIITSIETPIVVHSEKGRKFQMKDRPCYGLSLCASGQITYTMNEKRYVSNQTNAILLPQGGAYSLYGDKEGIFPVVNFGCENLNCSEIVVLPLENPQACIKFLKALRICFYRTQTTLKYTILFMNCLIKYLLLIHKNKILLIPLQSI